MHRDYPPLCKALPSAPACQLGLDCSRPPPPPSSGLPTEGGLYIVLPRRPSARIAGAAKQGLDGLTKLLQEAEKLNIDAQRGAWAHVPYKL